MKKSIKKLINLAEHLMSLPKTSMYHINKKYEAVYHMANFYDVEFGVVPYHDVDGNLIGIMKETFESYIDEAGLTQYLFTGYEPVELFNKKEQAYLKAAGF